MENVREEFQTYAQTVCLSYAGSAPQIMSDAILVNKRSMVMASPVLKEYIEAAKDGRRIFRVQNLKWVEIPKLMIHDKGIYVLLLRNDILPPALEIFKSFLETLTVEFKWLDGRSFSRVMKFAKVYNVSALKTLCTLEEIRRFGNSKLDWQSYQEQLGGDTYYTPCQFERFVTGGLLFACVHTGGYMASGPYCLRVRAIGVG